MNNERRETRQKSNIGRHLFLAALLTLNGLLWGGLGGVYFDRQLLLDKPTPSPTPKPDLIPSTTPTPDIRVEVRKLQTMNPIPKSALDKIATQVSESK